MLFDTHTHLNFKAFEGKVDEVLKDSFKSGIKYINIVGTDITSSQKAIEIAQKFDGVFATIGIHPHHIFAHKDTPESLDEHLKQFEELIQEKKVLAVGETGMDRHIYGKTKYDNYQIEEKFISLQKKAFKAQIKLALKYQKTLVIHNISAVEELLKILEENWDKFFEGRAVFHCCEPDQRLLDFAVKNKFFIGIDGDITYYPQKQEFIKKIPLELLVLETDSPFLTPEGFKNPNTPSNLNYIAEYIRDILQVDKKNLENTVFRNSQKLFGIDE